MIARARIRPGVTTNLTSPSLAVIPIRIQAYASTLASYIAKLNEGYPGQLPMRVLSECLMKFAQAAKHTDQEADTLDRLTRLSATVRDSKDAHLRHLNDRLALERCPMRYTRDAYNLA